MNPPLAASDTTTNASHTSHTTTPGDTPTNASDTSHTTTPGYRANVCGHSTSELRPP